MIPTSSELVHDDNVNIRLESIGDEKREVRLKTKIVATLGKIDRYHLSGRTSTRSRRRTSTYGEVLQEFYRAGVDIIRLNLSHFHGTGDVEATVTSLKVALRSVNCANGRPMSLLVDLPGPKIRLRSHPVPRGRRYKQGDEFRLALSGSAEADASGVLCIGSETIRDYLRAQVPPNDRFPDDLFSHADTDQLRQNTFGDKPKSGGARNRQFDSAITTAFAGEGCRITIGDGGIVLRATRFTPGSDMLECEVESCESRFSASDISNKGCTLQNVHLELQGFTRGDADLLSAALLADLYDLGGDPLLWTPAISFIGLSFCQSANDVFRLRSFLSATLAVADLPQEDIDLYTPMIIAKIETASGIANVSYIVDAADGIMVARGDLGLQQSLELIPEAQKQIIELCNLHGKPVITATQLLYSMASQLTPTRAEVTDVFNAVVDGTDAVMMSDETSPGRNPIESIRMMVRIAARAEHYVENQGGDGVQKWSAHRIRRHVEFAYRIHDRMMMETRRRDVMYDTLVKAKTSLRVMKVADVIRNAIDSRESYCQSILELFSRQPLFDKLTLSACMISESQQPPIRAIVTATRSGMTARAIARFRPQAPIVAATFSNAVRNRLALSRAVFPITVLRVETTETVEEIFVECRDAILKGGESTLAGIYLDDQSHVVFVTGTRINESGEINHIQVRSIGS